MTLLYYYYTNTIKQDLLTKFVYENVQQLPSLNKIVLNFAVSQATLKNLLPSLGALLLISSQNPCLVASKRLNLILKVKGGVTIGCKVDLREKDMFLFLEKLIFNVLPRLKAFRYTIMEKNVFFKVNNIFLFKEIEKEYEYFQDLPRLDVNLNFKATSSKEIQAFLSALKFPLL
uniref:Ribosomal protein L5 n=1 Tax=Monodopsis sp. MarTras21 TaxID=1745953 RepID=A0A140F2X2_9STRA|nr:ribosomal protein L5 [Monodopsis sp. MarTras21]